MGSKNFPATRYVALECLPILATGYCTWIHNDFFVISAKIITTCSFSALVTKAKPPIPDIRLYPIFRSILKGLEYTLSCLTAQKHLFVEPFWHKAKLGCGLPIYLHNYYHTQVSLLTIINFRQQLGIRSFMGFPQFVSVAL